MADGGAQRQIDQPAATVNSPAFVVSDDSRAEIEQTAALQAETQAEILDRQRGPDIGSAP